MRRQSRRRTRLALLIAPLLLAACDTLLAPRLPPPPEPWLPTQPVADPGEQSPLYPQN